MLKKILSNIKHEIGTIRPTRKDPTNPKALYDRYITLILIGILVFLAGIAMFFTPITIAIAILMMCAGIGFMLASLYMKYMVENKRYDTVIGEITFMKERLTDPSLSSWMQHSMRRPSYYHVRCIDTGEIYQLTAGKRDQEMPIGSTIKMYFPDTATKYIRNNIIYITPIWTYEILNEDIFVEQTSV